MKTSHSLTFNITNNTFVTSYYNGYSQSCTFIEDGESLSICFDRNYLSKLSETINKLQKVYQILVEERQRQIARELNLKNLTSLSLPVCTDDGKKCHEVKISF